MLSETKVLQTDGLYTSYDAILTLPLPPHTHTHTLLLTSLYWASQSPISFNLPRLSTPGELLFNSFNNFKFLEMLFHHSIFLMKTYTLLLSHSLFFTQNGLCFSHSSSQVSYFYYTWPYLSFNFHLLTSVFHSPRSTSSLLCLLVLLSYSLARATWHCWCSKAGKLC